MTNGGFGFSFGFDDDDDDERRGRDNHGRDNHRNNNFNPFEAFGQAFGFPGPSDKDGRSPGDGQSPGDFGPLGGLGDMFNQLGAMMSHMGSSMDDEDKDAVDFEVVKRVALRYLGRTSPAKDSSTVAEAMRLAELWIDDTTVLPAAGGTQTSWNAVDWIENTLPVWKRLVLPFAEHTTTAQIGAIPEEARSVMGPMQAMLKHMGAMSVANSTGRALAELAQEVLTGADFGLPLNPAGVTALLPRNLKDLSKSLDLPPQEMLVYVAAREVARQRLFHHVPWLREQVVSSIQEYAAGMELDTSALDEAMRNLDMQGGDPQALHEAMQNLQSEDIAPKLVSRNERATSRLETLLALIEGWVDHVVYQALSPRLPSTDALHEAWRRRRATGGSADKALKAVVGIDISAPRILDAAELWKRTETAVGIERRDAVWDHPDFVPGPEDLDNSAAFIDGLLGDKNADDFDPIAEITKLEEMLKNQSEGNDSPEGEDNDEDKGTTPPPADDR